MSTGAEDYVVFDYLRYVREILPAALQLTQGNQLPLRSLIIDDLYRGESLPSPALLHLIDTRRRNYEWAKCLLDTLARHQELAGADPLDEEKLFRNIASLQDIASDDELLKTYLLTMYCCDVLPWSPSWNWPNHGDFLLHHDEAIWEWEAYADRDEEQAVLWKPLSLPVPEPLRPYLQSDLQKQNAYDRIYHPRSISTPHLPGQITGFLTIEEIQHLLEQVRTREMPPADRLADYIERLWPMPPEEVEVYRQRYCENLWMIEEEILIFQKCAQYFEGNLCSSSGMFREKDLAKAAGTNSAFEMIRANLRSDGRGHTLPSSPAF